MKCDKRQNTRYIPRSKFISRNVNQEYHDNMTFGQRAADAVARFGGSWTFIIVCPVILLAWVGLNSYVLVVYDQHFDPFPYILLNLVLSMMAAIQAPIIMMSQNRQSEKDRLAALHDYEINLKAEMEIRSLHDKIDLLLAEPK